MAPSDLGTSLLTEAKVDAGREQSTAKSVMQKLLMGFIVGVLGFLAKNGWNWYTHPQPQSCTRFEGKIQTDLDLALSLVETYSQKNLTTSHCTMFLSSFRPLVDAMKEQVEIMQAGQTESFFCTYPQPADELRRQIMSVDGAFMRMNMTVSDMSDACTSPDYLRPLLGQFSSEWVGVTTSVQGLLSILRRGHRGSQTAGTFLAADLPNCTQHLQDVADSLHHGMHLISMFRLDVAAQLATPARSEMFASQFREAMSRFEVGESQLLPRSQNCHLSVLPAGLAEANQKLQEHFSSCGLSLDQWVENCGLSGATNASAHHWDTSCQTSFRSFLSSWTTFRGQAKRVVKHLRSSTRSVAPLYLASLPPVHIVKFSQADCQCQANAATHTYGKMKRVSGFNDRQPLSALSDHCSQQVASTLNLISVDDMDTMERAQQNADRMHQASKDYLGETSLTAMTDAAVAGSISAARTAMTSMKGVAYVEGQAEGSYLGTGLPSLYAYTSMAEAALLSEDAVVAGAATAGGVAIILASASFGMAMGLSAIAEYGMNDEVTKMNTAAALVQSDFEGVHTEIAAFKEQVGQVINNVHMVCETSEHTREEMKHQAWLGLDGCTTAMMTIHSDLTHALSDVTQAVAQFTAAHDDYNRCYIFCGEEPTLNLPDNAEHLVMQLQEKLDQAENAMYSVASCSRGNECLPGQLVQWTSQMQESMTEASNIAEMFMS